MSLQPLSPTFLLSKGEGRQESRGPCARGVEPSSGVRVALVNRVGASLCDPGALPGAGRRAGPWLRPLWALVPRAVSEPSQAALSCLVLAPRVAP